MLPMHPRGYRVIPWRGGTMSRQDDLHALLAPERQPQVLKDLGDFFGPGSEAFFEVYDKMKARKLSGVQIGWNWPVFLFSFVWFFYRKMWIFGASVILLPVILSLLIGSAGLGGGAIIFAMVANSIYVRSALSRILKADALGLTGEARSDYLRRAGGVSPVAGGIAAVLFVLFFAAAIYGILAGPPPA